MQRWLAVLVVALTMAGCSDDAVDQPDGSAAPGGDAEEGAGADDEEPADEADDDWITFESPEGGFRVELPSEPESNVQSVPSQAGPLEAAVFTVEVDADTGYIVAYTDYPEEVLEVEPGTVLDGAVQGAATNVSGTVESSTKLTVEGFPAVDYVIAVDGGRVEARAILAGSRIYLLQRAASQPDQDEFRRLVDSFELLAT
jgi:hypothetical protein